MHRQHGYGNSEHGLVLAKRRTALRMLPGVSLALLCGACSHEPERGAANASSPPTVAVDYLTTPITRADSVAIIRAVWDKRLTPTNARAAQLLTPPSSDSTMLAMSDSMLSELQDAGIALRSQPSVGDDTVLYRVRAFTRSTGALQVRLQSHWTTQIGIGSRRCRTGSGNTQSYAVTRDSTGWRAIRIGPVVHGDNACRPV